MCGGSSAYSGSWRHSGYAAPWYCDGGWAVIILDTWVQQVEPGALARRTGEIERIPGQHELAAVCGVAVQRRRSGDDAALWRRCVGCVASLPRRQGGSVTSRRRCWDTAAHVWRHLWRHLWRLRQTSAGGSRGSLKTRWIEAGTSVGSPDVTHASRLVAHAKLGCGICGHLGAIWSA
jgi:hypothetical protein